MLVTICGPNLSGVGQRKGQFHVHAAGCSDIERDPQRNGYAGAAPHMDAEVETVAEVVAYIYSDHMAEAEEGSEWTTWEPYVQDFHFSPCCRKGLQ